MHAEVCGRQIDRGPKYASDFPVATSLIGRSVRFSGTTAVAELLNCCATEERGWTSQCLEHENRT
jgi:hypothetical protein